MKNFITHAKWNQHPTVILKDYITLLFRRLFKMEKLMLYSIWKLNLSSLNSQLMVSITIWHEEKIIDTKRNQWLEKSRVKLLEKTALKVGQKRNILLLLYWKKGYWRKSYFSSNHDFFGPFGALIQQKNFFQEYIESGLWGTPTKSTFFKFFSYMETFSASLSSC